MHMLYSSFQRQYQCRKNSFFITIIFITFTNGQKIENLAILERYSVVVLKHLLCQKIHKIGIIGVFTEVKRQIHIKNRCPITVELFMMENYCKWCLSLFEYTNDIHLFIQERENHQKITLFGK